MKRSMSIFALLVAASMLIWLAGCGGDDEEEEDLGPAPEVTSISVAEGGAIAANASISVTFNKKVDDGSMAIAVSGATGAVTWDAAGKVATWAPAPDMSEGAHALSVSGSDAGGQDLKEAKTVNFTATVADTTAPKIKDADCDPKNGATGVDPSGYTALKIVFDEAMDEAKVDSIDPAIEPNPTAELADATLTLTFLGGFKMPNETEYKITLSGKDKAGNALATTEYKFTTMAKEE